MKKDRASQIKERIKKLDSERLVLLKELKALAENNPAKISQPKNEIEYPSLGVSKYKYPTSSEQKIDLFKNLFVCRENVFPKFWENSAKSKKGYSPACNNDWVKGVCEKPKMKCSNCPNQSFKLLNEHALSEHLLGKTIIGTYAINTDDTCKFLAADFDGKNWEEDLVEYYKAGKSLGIDVILERSRSGNGGHAWIFFTSFISAHLARQLGFIILTKAISTSPQFDLNSYDRFFPNQDYIPKGGFGNLIALPLQKKARENNNSVFINTNLEPFADQWKRLSSIKILSHFEVSNLVSQFKEKNQIKDSFSDDFEGDVYQSNQLLDLTTLKKPGSSLETIKELKVVLASQIYVNIENVPTKIINSLKRLATFANPEFFKMQRLRFSTWNIPRYIFCGDYENNQLILPSGLIDKIKTFCSDLEIELKIDDKRTTKKKFRTSFVGKLRIDQKNAVKEVSNYESGILVAPPGSGKTVMACSIIAKRKTPTLILVHRAPLLEQWKERLSSFLKFDSKDIGTINGQKKKPLGKIDLAMMQTINKMKSDDLIKLLDSYEQIIIDECHHVAAFTFEAILKKSSCRYTIGLTATPYRKDGHQSIIHMQCGPTRYELKENETIFKSKRLIAQSTNFSMDEDSADQQPPLHIVWSKLIIDQKRADQITNDIIDNINGGRTPLVISERKEHLDFLRYNLIKSGLKEESLFLLTGDLTKKQRAIELERINDSVLNKDLKTCILTTGSLIGEGFDLPALDTLFITMPVSFKGKVVQYAGRIHRSYEGKTEVRIYDYVDINLGLTNSMFKKRLKAYKSMNYQIEASPDINLSSNKRQRSLFYKAYD